jgi:hypothetical protein
MAMNRPRGKSKLFPYQLDAVNQLKTGSILCGGVGSGKSITSVYYYYVVECNDNPSKDLYIITTAKKRDTLDWERECAKFALATDRDSSINGVQVKVDSWNNIKKYIDVDNAFFIFDEQRVVGSGAWVKSFIKITKKNNWILLSATPGDTWMDYIPVFVANNFYKNRTQFIRRHVVYNSFVRFPKVERFLEEGRLNRLKRQVIVMMKYIKKTESIYKTLWADYDKEKLKLVTQKRWNPFTDKPIKQISELFVAVRKVVNSDPTRLDIIKELLEKHRKIIIFYNFNYELEILRTLKEVPDVKIAEWNGHKHEPLPEGESWAYLVQYLSGGEGWNCIETNVIVFYSLNYSYRIMTQAAGRIDRMNTPFAKLYYYRIVSPSWIDAAIRKALIHKKNFNESELKLALKTKTIMEGE